MSQDFVFIATLGQNDLHVVYRPEGERPRRHPLRKESVRAFHQDCLEGRIRYRLTPLEETAVLQPRKREELEFVRDCGSLVSPETFGSESRVELGVDGELELCAPLLADACSEIRQKIDRGELGRARHVLLLNTRRDDVDEKGQRRERGEPIATGAIVRNELAAAFGLDDLAAVEEHFFLTSGDLYESDARNQRHLRCNAAWQIDHRVRELARQFPQAVALISDVGGFPETKAVLAASVNYRFDGRFEFVRPVERSRSLTRRSTLIIPAAESLTTRHQIVRLVRRGCFDAAAELARHPAGDEALQAEPWRQAVLDYAAYLRMGQLPGPEAVGNAAKHLLKLRSLRSQVILFRIEAALRRDDWELAIRETVTFVEVALFELIDRHASQPGGHCVDWERLVVIVEKLNDIQRARHQGMKWVEIQEKDDRKAAVTWLPEGVRDHWSDVFEATRDKAVRTARNVATHGRISPSQLRSACDALIQQRLWTQLPDTVSILKAKLAQPLFDDLGLSDIRDRYERGLACLLEDLDVLSPGGETCNTT